MAAATTMPPELAVEECQLLAGTKGKLVQCLLFCVCCGTLLFKYYRHAGGRTFTEFLLDSSKQLMGAGWIHCLNLIFAAQLEEHFEELGGDQCDWYWINIVIDTSIGVGVTYLLLQLITFIISMLCAAEAGSCKSGEYRKGDGKMDYSAFTKQVCIWLGVISIMKACMVQLMIVAATAWLSVARLLLAGFADPTVKLLVVMILTPLFMNSFQFWVTDNFIKKKGDADAEDVFERDGEGNSVRIRDDDL